MKNQLQVVVEQSGLEENKIQTLLSSFNSYFKEAQAIADKSRNIVVSDETQTEEMALARQSRLELKNIRVKVENTRKELKEQSLREGKAIDGIANVIKALIVPVEEHLEKQEKFVEELQKAKAAEKLAKRQEALSKYVPDISLYNLDQMSNETFDKLLESSKQAFIAQQEAARKAEEERVAREKAEAEERERIRLENEKLRKEAEAREKELAVERAKQEVLLKKEREEKERILAEERKKAEAERLKQEEALRKEREAREKAEAKIRAEKEAAEKLRLEEEIRQREALVAPDKNKLLLLAETFESIELPVVQSEEAKKTIEDIGGMVGRLSTFIKQRANNL